MCSWSDGLVKDLLLEGRTIQKRTFKSLSTPAQKTTTSAHCPDPSQNKCFKESAALHFTSLQAGAGTHTIGWCETTHTTFPWMGPGSRLALPYPSRHNNYGDIFNWPLFHSEIPLWECTSILKLHFGMHLHSKIPFILNLRDKAFIIMMCFPLHLSQFHWSTKCMRC